jgi:hypothetical protein
MSAGRSPTLIASPALHPSVPTRALVAARRAEHRHGPLQRRPSRRDRAVIAHWHAIAVDSIVTIVAVITACGIPHAQIPIAQRRS